MRKLRLLRLLRRGEQCAAMTVGGNDEASGDVAAEKRNLDSGAKCNKVMQNGFARLCQAL
jgi:hypothetical protein